MAALELKLQECFSFELNKQKVTHTQTKPNVPAPIYTQLPHPELMRRVKKNIFMEKWEKKEKKKKPWLFFPAEL